jgi:hypothetical protein
MSRRRETHLDVVRVIGQKHVPFLDRSLPYLEEMLWGMRKTVRAFSEGPQYLDVGPKLPDHHLAVV